MEVGDCTEPSDIGATALHQSGIWRCVLSLICFKSPNEIAAFELLKKLPWRAASSQEHHQLKTRAREIPASLRFVDPNKRAGDTLGKYQIAFHGALKFYFEVTTTVIFKNNNFFPQDLLFQKLEQLFACTTKPISQTLTAQGKVKLLLHWDHWSHIEDK